MGKYIMRCSQVLKGSVDLPRGFTFYPLPSVMDADSFVRFVRSRTSKFANILEKESLIRDSGLRSRAFDANVTENVRKMLDSLLHLQVKDVQRLIWEKYKLCDERLVTCLVPYQLGVNIILSRLPNDLKQKCIIELQEEELRIENGNLGDVQNKYIQWTETDVFVSTGTRYLQRLSKCQHKRIPICAVIGHHRHGKTTLLDALHGTDFAQEESRGNTQSVRALTACSPGDSNTCVTFLDTPGIRLFVETRLHAHIIADFVLLLVSLVDGVQSQTYEGIKIALNLDKPIFVVFNKIDLFSDPLKAAEAISKALSDLHSAGLNVEMLQKNKHIERLRAIESSLDAGEIVSTNNEKNLSELFAPMKNLDSNFRGSRKNPVVDLHRRCVGVCISAKDRKNFDLLWSVLELATRTYPPLCHSTSSDYKSHKCSVQAVILESSKHLFDEEAFRLSKHRQRLQQRQDAVCEKRQRRFEQNSISIRIHSVLSAARGKAFSSNPTSSNCLVLTVIVKEGCITRGMPFVADQSRGCVDYMVDALGNSIDEALPGMSVTVIDVHSNTGCPGVGTHLLSMPSVEERDRIFEYRRLLQWYVECFPSRLNLLRPRGMNVLFAHLGDYGQLGNTSSLDYQLLYGPLQRALAPGDGVPASSNKSLVQYLNEKNAEHSAGNELLLGADGDEKNSIMEDNVREALLTTWKALQPSTQPQNQEEFDKLCEKCTHVGVLFKVDSWHSARMLLREITRLGTRKVLFQVVGMRFGELVLDDVFFFQRTMKVVICYRTPVAASTDLDRYLEVNDTWVLQTDDISDVTLFLKWCAVALHKEHAPEDFNAMDLNNKKSHFMILNGSLRKKTSDMDSHKEARRRKLLITPNSSH